LNNRSSIIEKTIGESQIRSKTGATVVAIIWKGLLSSNPNPGSGWERKGPEEAARELMKLIEEKIIGSPQVHTV